MRKYLVLLAVCIYSFISNAQNVGIGVPNPQNKLHVGGGFRLDTLTGVGGAGLVRHDANGVVYGIKFSGNASDVLRGDGTFGSYDVNGSIGWLLNGNSGTNPATHFIGTTDNQPLLFRVNNIRHGYLGNSIFFGKDAGIASTVGENIGIGERSLYSNVSSNANTALGFYTLEKNIQGTSNIAIGNFALRENTEGSYNIGIGYLALGANTKGSLNTSIGNSSLRSNTTGARNTAIGYFALHTNVIGLDNTAVGYNALWQNVGGLDPLFGIPFYGNHNTAVGSYALSANTTGSRNSAFGINALRLSQTTTDNSAFGALALEKNQAGFFNNAFGSGALKNNTSGTRNSAFGTESLATNTEGWENTAIGHSSLRENISYFNTALGASSLLNNTAGHDNTAIGVYAMRSNQTASFNTSVGAFSLYNYNGTTGLNTAIGYKAMYNSSGANNNAFGAFALENSTGSSNCAFGPYSLQKTSGGYGSSFGISALVNNTSGFGNTAVGGYALGTIETGNYNTGIGYLAGYGFNPNTPNLPLGLPPNVSNVTCIGFDAGFRTTGSNQVNIGNFSVGWIGGNVGWGTYSDKRMKQDIKEDVPGLAFISRLKPVTYHINLAKEKEIAKANPSDEHDWDGKYDIEKRKMTGFLAQDVEMAAAAINYNFSGVHKPKNGEGLYSLEYSAFVVPLVKAVQEQQIIIEKLQKQIDDLIKRIEALEKK